jgi:hypothetical protein
MPDKAANMKSQNVQSNNCEQPKLVTINIKSIKPLSLLLLPLRRPLTDLVWNVSQQ